MAQHEVLMSDRTREYLTRRLEEGGGVLAVQASLKMSGHLITLRAWAGRLLFFAKNSAENAYTRSAQMLLYQMMGGPAVQRLTAAMEERRICLSFECVTSFNGDHGYPSRTGIDIMLCTAIHSLSCEGPSVPWTTVQILSFCRKHGLPCTQTLLALDPDAARSVFSTYERLRHQFGPHASEVEDFFRQCSRTQQAVALDCIHHSLISNVIEGFVVKSIELSVAEVGLLLEMEQSGPKPLDASRIMCHDLRNAVYRQEKGPVLTEVGAKILCQQQAASEEMLFSWPLHKLGKPDRISLSKDILNGGGGTGAHGDIIGMLRDLLMDAEGSTPSLPSTLYISNILKKCVKLRIRADLLPYQESLSSSAVLTLVMVHVMRDSDHYKFQKDATGNETLYRGFAIRLYRKTDSGGRSTTEAEVFANFYPKFDNAKQEEGEKIIRAIWMETPPKVGQLRKFKLSYYTYVTMLCRALLQGREKDKPPSHAEWRSACAARLSTWSMSLEEQRPYLSRLSGWHAYVLECLSRRVVISSTSFLDHFGRFLAEEPKWVSAAVQKLRGGHSGHLSRAVIVLDASCPPPSPYAKDLASCLDLPLKCPGGVMGDEKHQRNRQQRQLADVIFSSQIVSINICDKSTPEGNRRPRISCKLAKGATLSPDTVVVAESPGMLVLDSSEAKSEFERWVDTAKRSGCTILEMGDKNPLELSQRLLFMEGNKVVPELILPCGIPGSGKSALAEALREELDVAVICSDGPKGVRKDKFDTELRLKLRPKFGEPRLLLPSAAAVYRDKNAASEQYATIVAMGSPGRVIAVAFGSSEEELERAPTCEALTDWEVAVCMRRVLSRGTHDGGLDAQLPHALQVVANFANIYRGRFSTRADFIDNLKRLCGSDRVLYLPICNSEQFSRPMPDSIRRLLAQAANHKNPLKLGPAWEAGLRAALAREDAAIKAVEANVSGDLFKSKLQHAMDDIVSLCSTERISLPPCRSTEGIPLPPCRRPSSHQPHMYMVSFDPDRFYAALLEAAPALPAWLEEMALPLDLTRPVHVTLAFRPTPDVRQAMEALVGLEVDVRVSCCAADGKAAALVVADMSPSSVFAANKYPHITLATGGNVSSRYSNDMLEGGCLGYSSMDVSPRLTFRGVVMQR